MATQSKVNLINDIITRMNSSVNLLHIVDEDNTSDDISAGSIRSNKYYRIKEIGDTDFTDIGASDNEVGTVFLSPSIRNGNPIDGTTGLVNEVDPIYGETPFIPNKFKYFDNGMIRDILDLTSIPIELHIEPRRKILVEITSAELERESIYSVIGNNPGEIPLQSWIGSVGIELLVYAEDNSIYNQVYDELLIMHEDQFRDVIELNSTIIDDGIERSLEMKSKVFKDGEQLHVINGDNFKEMFFPININIANKGILRSSRYRIQYRTSAESVSPEIWEEIPLGVSAKDFKYTKLHQDDTNSGESVRKSVADIADRELAFNVVWDIDKKFIQALEVETEKSRFDDTEYTYTLKKIKEYADGTNAEYTYKMSLVSAIENNTSAYNVSLVTFIEVV